MGGGCCGTGWWERGEEGGRGRQRGAVAAMCMARGLLWDVAVAVAVARRRGKATHWLHWRKQQRPLGGGLCLCCMLRGVACRAVLCCPQGSATTTLPRASVTGPWAASRRPPAPSPAAPPSRWAGRWSRGTRSRRMWVPGGAWGPGVHCVWAWGGLCRRSRVKVWWVEEQRPLRCGRGPRDAAGCRGGTTVGPQWVALGVGVWKQAAVVAADRWCVDSMWGEGQRRPLHTHTCLIRNKEPIVRCPGARVRAARNL